MILTDQPCVRMAERRSDLEVIQWTYASDCMWRMAPLSHPLRFLLVALAGWINQQQRDVIDYLREENRVLREQLGPRRVRFTDDQRVRLAAKAKRLGRRALAEISSLVTPDTLLTWHRALIARKYDGPPKGRPGRPGVMAEIRQLVVRMASENRAWGYTRIQGALANLHHQVARGTIANILKQHRIEPAPERQKRTTWQEFPRGHGFLHGRSVDGGRPDALRRPLRHRPGDAARRDCRHPVRARQRVGHAVRSPDHRSDRGLFAREALLAPRSGPTVQ